MMANILFLFINFFLKLNKGIAFPILKKKKKKELNTVALTDAIYEKVRSSFFPAAALFDRTMFYGLAVFVGSVEHSFFFVQFRLTNRVVRF